MAYDYLVQHRCDEEERLLAVKKLWSAVLLARSASVRSGLQHEHLMRLWCR